MHTRDETTRSAHLLAWPGLFLALVAVRMVLPAIQVDAYLAHSAVVDSLLSAHSWGRQALVGSTEFPLLPTLALLTTRLAGGLLHVDGGRLLIAVSQAWVATYVLRLMRRRPHRIAAVVVGVLSLLIPDVADALGSQDPNWAAMVPLFSIVYHLGCWYREGELRDAVVCAIAAGLLLFAGPLGIVFAAGVLVLMSRGAGAVPTGADEQNNRGLVLLLWAPFLYCCCLLILWNWLVMGRPLFALGRVLAGLGSTTAVAFVAGAAGHALALTWLSWAALVGLTAAAWRERGGAFLCLGVGFGAAMAAACSSRAIGVVPAGAGVLFASAGLVLAGAGVAACVRRGACPSFRAVVLPVGILLLVALLRPADSVARQTAFADGAPPASEITRWVDRHWPRSRMAVYGIRAPAIYHDTAEARFLARVDYHETLLMERSHDEQMHLLVPPDNGRFYTVDSAFHSIHAEGRPWLLLEREWPSGWQLWRCVMTPPGESRLTPLE